MNNITVYIATSVDGFIARENGDIEWLHNSGHGKVGKGEDFGYKAFISTIDAMVIGRKTYEKVLGFGGEWPYGEKPVFVLTSKGVEIPDKIRNTVSSFSGSPKQITEKLAEGGYHNLYLDGGITIQKFMDAGLVDELIITKIPILIGQGIPLFGPLSKDVKLKHIETNAFSNGFVQSRYEVLK